MPRAKMNALRTLLTRVGIDASILDTKEGQMYLQIAVIIVALGVGLVTYFNATRRTKMLGPVAVLPTSTDFHNAKLVQKVALSHNTALYRFQIPHPLGHIPGVSPEPILGLPIGQHISLTAEINGKNVQRKYTPTTLDGEDPGHFHLVVKTYEQGNISKYLSLLTIGQDVKVKGPSGKFIYHKDLSPHLLMIAGGTGITPMYQIIKASIQDPKDQTKLSLIYANVNEDDILLRSELKELEAKSAGRLQVHYVLNNAPDNWTGGTGFVTSQMIEKYMPEGGASVKDSKVLLCGPPPMIEAMKRNLGSLGYPAPRALSKLEDQVFCF